MTESWRDEARAAETGRRTIWFWSPAFIAIGALAIIGGIQAPIGWIHWSGLICGGALTLWGFIYGTAIYMRTVDEQERDANLWGCYVGMCAYLLLFAITALLDYVGRPIPYAPYVVFFTTMMTVLAVFAWKRFR